jgi:glycerophosphoryl diester phosphodiesterase
VNCARTICVIATSAGMVMLLGHETVPAAGAKKLVAHRGASAYAPEHTLAAYRLALEQGADYVEQDLAVTRDGVLICLHDDTLERTTNVEELFPDRATKNARTGRPEWLAVDFTLAELKQLDAGSWFDAKFAGERIPTWAEAVGAVGTRAGLYPELKSPPLYTERGIDMVRLFVESLRELGLSTRPRGALLVQSFDETTVRRLARELPEVPRTLLIDTRDGERWLSGAGLREAATFATDLGPAKGLLAGRAGLVGQAHRLGLTVTPYTFRGADEMHQYLYELNVDALFTDNPDLFPRTARNPVSR